MKVQSQPQAAVLQPANPTPSADVAAKPASAGFAPGSMVQLPARFQDGFEQRPVDPNKPGIIDCIPPPYRPPIEGSLSMEDRLTSMKLPMALANPLNKALLEAGDKDVVLSRDVMGMMRGPEGQPLAQVWLNDGTTAYVDPNTNQYYLTDERETYGRTNAMGPLELPAGAQFSNSFFNDPEVRSIQRMSQAGGPFPGPVDPLPFPPRPQPFPENPGPLPPLPLPLPEPPIPENSGPLPPLPLPLPGPRIPENPGPLPPLPLPLPGPRIPEDWLGPILNLDPSVLLAAGAGKAPSLE